jgi:hypothetical protein
MFISSSDHRQGGGGVSVVRVVAVVDDVRMERRIVTLRRLGSLLV